MAGWRIVAFVTSVFVIVIIPDRGILGAKIGEPCEEGMGMCPNDSACLPKGCEGNVCLCNEGFVATTDSSQCKQAVDLGRPCGAANQKCRAVFSYCNPATNKCSCYDSFTPSKDNLRCKPDSPPLTFALLRENCDALTTCYGQFVQCNTSLARPVCVCGPADKYRAATEEELRANPFSPLECRTLDFALEDTNVTCPEPEPPLQANIDKTCYSDNNCVPANSECLPRGCDGKVCVCKSGTRATPDDTQCLTVVPLGGDCSSNDTLCARSGLETRCSANGTCECMEYLEERNGRCRPESTVIPPVYVSRVALLGEECGERRIGGYRYVDTCGELFTICDDDGFCVCKDGYRNASDKEKESDPDRFTDCVHQNYTLEADQTLCNDIDVNPPRQAESTTLTYDASTSN